MDLIFRSEFTGAYNEEHDGALRRPEYDRYLMFAGASGEWNDDDYDVFAADGVVVGRIFRAAASPIGSPWMWTLAFEQHKDRTPTHGYEARREAAMAAFAKSWRREYASKRPIIPRGAAGQQPPLPEPLAVWSAMLYFRPAHQLPASAPFGRLIPLLSFCADSLQAIEINGGGSFGVEFLTTSLY
jgi:hypothetical protein